MDFYYSISCIYPHSAETFLLNDPEGVDKVVEFFDFLEKDRQFDGRPTHVIQITCTAESWLGFHPDYRDLSEEKIYEITGQVEPSEFYSTGARVEIVSHQLFEVLRECATDYDVLSAPIQLHNPLSNRSWDNYFAIRFTRLKKRQTITTEPMFVDDKTFAFWFNQDTMTRIDALKIPNIRFDKMLPLKFQ